MKNNNCGNCYFRQHFYEGYTACHYSIITGQLRACPANECDKYISDRYVKHLLYSGFPLKEVLAVVIDK